MNYSRRFTWEARPNAFSLARAALAASGRRLLDLTLSNPTRAGIPYPEDLLAALADPRALRYEPTALGLRPAREAVSEYYASLGANVHPDRVILTASTSEAYQYLFKLLADPGDEVLVPTPSYPLFQFLAGLELLDTVPYSLTHDDPCNLATRRTRALVAVHPNNPTGTYLTAGTAAALTGRCADLGMGFLVDEVFLDYPLRESAAATCAGLEAGAVFVLSGLSKICGLPQMKLGWMVLAGEPNAEARDRLELIADTYLSVSAPVQWAAIEWLRQRQRLQEPICERIRSNSTRIEQVLRRSEVAYEEPQAGWTAVLRLPSTVDEEVLGLRLLNEWGVLTQPGYFYDYSGAPRLVVSLLTPPEDLVEGLEALKTLIASY